MDDAVEAVTREQIVENEWLAWKALHGLADDWTLDNERQIGWSLRDGGRAFEWVEREACIERTVALFAPYLGADEKLGKAVDRLAETRGLVRGLTASLENRNDEIAALKARVGELEMSGNGVETVTLRAQLADADGRIAQQASYVMGLSAAVNAQHDRAVAAEDQLAEADREHGATKTRLRESERTARDYVSSLHGEIERMEPVIGAVDALRVARENVLRNPLDDEAVDAQREALSELFHAHGAFVASIPAKEPRDAWPGSCSGHEQPAKYRTIERICGGCGDREASRYILVSEHARALDAAVAERDAVIARMDAALRGISRLNRGKEEAHESMLRIEEVVSAAIALTPDSLRERAAVERRVLAAIWQCDCRHEPRCNLLRVLVDHSDVIRPSALQEHTDVAHQHTGDCRWATKTGHTPGEERSGG